MKHHYTSVYLAICVLVAVLFSPGAGHSQTCPWGYTPDTIQYSATLATSSGNYTTFFKVPQFDPQVGLLIKTRILMTMTGIVNMLLENNVSVATSYDIDYFRRDSLSGPGLAPPLTKFTSKNYGPFALAATNGISFSGPDFITIGPDSILKASTVTRNITNSNLLDTFYGLDSLTYRYKIKVDAQPNGSGDYLFVVSTAGLVTLRVQYLYCPTWLLPVNVYDFGVKKLNAGTAGISWKAESDTNSYHYEVQMSKDGRDFKTVQIVEKSNMNHQQYETTYQNQDDLSGRVFFRIKQKFLNGYTQFSNVKSLEFENKAVLKFNIYPNPSTGIVGIKFDNISSGKLLVLITNAQGQTVVRKEIEVAGPAYKEIATLQRGVYWLRLNDVTSHLSCVNQLFIK